MRIFGVRVDNLSPEEVVARVEDILEEARFHQIATVNPEFLLLARKDQVFRDILNSCDLNVVDGTGIRFAFWRAGERLRGRFPGADLMHEILLRAEHKNLHVFCALKEGGLSRWEEVQTALQKRYPSVRISGADINVRLSDYSKILPLTKKAHIVLCNFGAPQQEMFLSELRKGARSIRLAMGVGGSFDYLTGKVKRAPKWMRVSGLEWLWRFLQQPKRWKRIFNAVVVFPLMILGKSKEL
jgi:N-acetylglucosaminyldiphosphoundecaprenol N-acetyl-beta-D-mannosaminyltransferase